ncbi:MAG: prolyl oligopeptidase family serine peptidase [Myxococcales bacterium]
MRGVVFGVVLLCVSCGADLAKLPSTAAHVASERAPSKPSATPEPGPPSAPRRPTSITLHGVAITDDYQWLEPNSDEVKAWSEAQNAATRRVLDAFPGRAELTAQVRKLMAVSTPAWSGLQFAGGHLFALERLPPKQQPFLVVMQAPSPEGARVAFDPNLRDPTGGTSIDWFRVSDDAKWVAVSLSQGGSESGSVHVFDVATGHERSEDTVPYVQGGTAGGSLAWTKDATGFWYTRYPHPGERPQADLDFYQQLYFHRLGMDPKLDTPSLVDDLPRIAEIQLERSEDGRFLLANVANGDGGEVAHFLLDTRAKTAKFRKIADYAEQVKEAKFGFDGRLWLRSIHDAPHGRLLALDPARPELAQAKVVVPESTAVIESFEVTKRRLFVLDQLAGEHGMRRFDVTGKPLGGLPLLPVSSVEQVVRLAGDDLLFSNESYLEAPAWYQWDDAHSALGKTALAETPAASFGDAEVVRETCTSKDGSAVPLTILRRKDAVLNGNHPFLLYGYGGYSVNLTPRYRALQRVWLDQSGIFAVANLRGGGELGEAWHQAGQLTHKQNVFDDFIACAQHVIDAGYTRPEWLTIKGASNGGLLMGAALTQAPQLFRAVVSGVGIYDMLRVESTPNGAFNVTEFGTVKDEAQFRALYDYSPYHRVRDGVRYPAVLLMTGENDPRVDPFHSRKMAARLQVASSSKLPVLLRTSGNTGHGYGTPLDAAIEEQVDTYAFLFGQLGISVSKSEPEPPGDRSTEGVIGAVAPEWQTSQWFNSPPLTLASLRGRPVFVRWFTSPDCPFCSASAPALRELHTRYAKQGLVVVGMYHHKEPTPLDPKDVLGWAHHYGYEFPVAIDAHWRTLNRWWLEGHPNREYTSVSFLLDRKGVIRRVHLGGLIDAKSADFRALETDVERLLAER